MNDLNIKFIKAMKEYRKRRDYPEELLKLINRRRQINSNRGVSYKRECEICILRFIKEYGSKLLKKVKR